MTEPVSLLSADELAGLKAHYGWLETYTHEPQYSGAQNPYWTIKRLLAHIAALTEERDGLKEARFNPIGDNHHNAMLCPHCNPDRVTARTSALKEAAEVARAFVIENKEAGLSFDSWEIEAAILALASK